MSMWNEELQCEVATAVFNFEDNKAVLVLPDLNCTDMDGVIRWSQRLMPAVTAIVVYEGPARTEGTVYRKLGSEWKANGFDVVAAR